MLDDGAAREDAKPTSPAHADQTWVDTQRSRVGDPLLPAREHATPKGKTPALADPLLAMSADVLDDMEKVRVANQNRLRQLTRDEPDSDDEMRGFGLDESHPDVARLAALVDSLEAAEKLATKNLESRMRAHPMGPWVKATHGLGDKQTARLLAAIGDPYWNTLHGRPRTVSELWAYSGYHVIPVVVPAGQTANETQRPSAGDTTEPDQSPDAQPHTSVVGVAATPTRGQQSNWNSEAKKRAYIIGAQIVKVGGPYREVYDKARQHYAEAVHKVPCRRCGPSGKPAAVGSALSDGHKHARAIRKAAKEILKDMWIEAQRIHTK